MIHLLKLTVLAFSILLGCANPSFAGAQDYRFEILNQPIKASQDAKLTVLVTQLSIQKQISNLQITSQNLHMMMGSMDAPAKIQALTPDATGALRFKADLTMVGEWTLDLTATAAGEKEPLKASLKFQVVK
jgi:hypothetical protein